MVSTVGAVHRCLLGLQRAWSLVRSGAGGLRGRWRALRDSTEAWRKRDHALEKNPDFYLEASRQHFSLRCRHGGSIIRLNASAAFAWNRIDGIRTRAGLARSIATELPGDSRVGRDVPDVVRQLKQVGAIRLIPPSEIRGRIQVRYRGRLGNRLTSHCVSRVLAERLDFDLAVPAIDGFPGTEKYADPVNDEPYWDEELTGQFIPESTFRNTQPRNILMQGYFQNYDYFRDYRDSIRSEWLRISKLPLDRGHLVAHVRSGDVWGRYRKEKDHGAQGALPVSYYANLIRSISWDRLTLVTSHADDPIVTRLLELFDCDVRSESVLGDFRYVCSASKIIVSQSTFAWWAAWSSDAEEIHFPRAEMWAPGRQGHASFWVEDEDRYILHQPVLPRKWRGDAEDERIMVDC